MIVRSFFLIIAALIVSSCGGGSNKTDKHKGVISVSIAPFRYFTEAIAGDDFKVNIMVPVGSDPHIYEPTMVQMQSLSNSAAYISNGYLDFELAWLYRFYQMNPSMKIVSFGNNQELLYANAWEHGDHWHYEGVNPHFWISPKSAYRIAADIKDLVIELNPDESAKYEENYRNLVAKISGIDSEISGMLQPYKGRSFMIYHPALAYFARDYQLEQIAVEHQGKEPSPADVRRLIDTAREMRIKTIFVQQEFDLKNAAVIASEAGADVVTIDPLSEDWAATVMTIAKALAGSFKVN